MGMGSKLSANAYIIVTADALSLGGINPQNG